jgi:hypothetical protein
MYHRGTIFCDTASDHIHIKNQVSLGASETIAVRRESESWLFEEAKIADKHCHSANGIFKPDLFTALFKKYSQTQSFSSVRGHFKTLKQREQFKELYMWQDLL